MKRKLKKIIFEIKYNSRFKKEIEKIRRELSHYPKKKVDDVLPTGNIIILLLLKLAYKIFKLLYLKSVKESRKKNYALPLKENSTIFIANHLSHSDPFIISKLFLKYINTSYYVLSFASSHLNVIPIKYIYNLFGSFILRDSKMTDEDKRLLMDYIHKSKQHKISFLLFPEGTFSSSGTTMKMKSGILKNLLDSNYDNMILTKIQYNRVHDYNMNQKVIKYLKKTPIEKNSIAMIINRIKFTINYSTDSYVDAVKISLSPYRNKKIEKLKNEIGFQLNSMYIFEDIEKILLFMYTCKTKTIKIEYAYNIIIDTLKNKDKVTFKKNIKRVCSHFNLTVFNDIIIFNDDTDYILFNTVNQYIYAWLPYALTINNYKLNEVELESLYLSNSKMDNFMNIPKDIVIETILKDLDLKEHLTTLCLLYDVR